LKPACGGGQSGAGCSRWMTFQTLFLSSIVIACTATEQNATGLSSGEFRPVDPASGLQRSRNSSGTAAMSGNTSDNPMLLGNVSSTDLTRGESSNNILARRLTQKCFGFSDIWQATECTEAMVGGLGDLLKLSGAALAGKSTDVKQWLGGFASLIGVTLGVFLAPPFNFIAVVGFSLVRGGLMQLMANPNPLNPEGYVTMQKLFRQTARSNLVKYDALTKELDWFRDLFFKTDITHGNEIYKSAALSWLLNVQHDVSIDKALFFSADCLEAADKDNFQAISDGKCEDHGLNPITDTVLCETAAQLLKDVPMKVTTSTVKTRAYSFRPRGCYWYTNHKHTYLNLHKGAAKNEATTKRQLLCTSIGREARRDCAKWQFGGTWSAASLYAVLHLSVLLDIVFKFPALKPTILARLTENIEQYDLLLIQSFKVFKAARESYLHPPKVSKDWEGTFKCLLMGTSTMIKEGRDYWFKTLKPKEPEDGDDGKCRGKCDVMSTKLCEVRPQYGTGLKHSKYCVKDDKIAKATTCWKEYKRKVFGDLTEKFNFFTQQLEALRKKVKDAS